MSLAVDSMTRILLKTYNTGIKLKFLNQYFKMSLVDLFTFTWFYSIFGPFYYFLEKQVELCGI